MANAHINRLCEIEIKENNNNDREIIHTIIPLVDKNDMKEM